MFGLFRSACTLCLLFSANAVAASATVTQSLNAAVAPVAKVTVPPSLLLSPGPDRFTPFQAALPVSYSARTTQGGGGSITLQVTSDFAPSGGPSAAAGVLTYTCSGASLGQACSGVQTASTTAQTPVLSLPPSACTGGGGACSAQDPNAVTLNFSLADDPTYRTGTYSTRITFIVSAI